jgi:hypothetical protein
MSQFSEEFDDPYTAPKSPIPGAPARGNGLAVGSLVCGLLLCIPLVSGPISILLGIFGIRKASDPRVGGKGMAIAGILLGVLGMGFQVAAFSGFYALFNIGMKVATVPQEFLKDLSAGNIDAALAKCGPGIDRARLEETAKEMKAWGPFISFQPESSTNKTVNTQSFVTMGGTAKFQKETKQFTVTSVIETPSFATKVTEWSFK